MRESADSRERHAERMREYRAQHEDYRDQERERVRTRYSWWGQSCILNTLDGEADNDGRYNLLQVYDGSQVYSQHAPPGESLGCVSILDWLFSIARYQRQRYGAQRRIVWAMFGMGYDMDQWIGHEPSWTIEQKLNIAKQKSRSYGVVRGPNWCRDIVFPLQRLAVYVGRKTANFSRLGTSQQIEVWDVWSLVACSFVKAIEQYLETQKENPRYEDMAQQLALVRQGKAERGQWATLDAHGIARYNVAELHLLHAWLRHELDNLTKTRLAPRSLAGPAPLARASDRYYGTLEHVKPEAYDTVPYQEGDWMRAVRQSYYGGWIEQAVQGILEKSYEADLTSAYPYLEAQCPCGAHGDARRLTDDEIERARGGATLPTALYDIGWHHTGKVLPRFAPFPQRDGFGVIANTWRGRGIYHASLVQAFLDHDQGAGWDIYGGWLWQSNCEHAHPFAWAILDLFTRRQDLLSRGDSSEKTLKLALNSRYGLRAQTSGAARLVDGDGKTIGYKTPKHSNLYLASYITAGVRAILYRVLVQEGENAFGVATDALFFHKPPRLDVPTQKTLGAFTLAEHGRTLYLMPGVRFEAGAGGKNRVRGYASPLTYDQVYDAWRTSEPALAVTTLVYQDLRASALPDGTLKATWGTFQPMTRTLDLTAGALFHKRNVLDGGTVVDNNDASYYPPHRMGATNLPYTRPIDRGVLPLLDPDAESEYAE